LKGVVQIVHLTVKEWKGQPKLIETIPIFFLTIIVQVCTNKTKNVMNTNCISLHVAPNMANNTQNHGYMKKERLILELDIRNIYVWTHDTYTKVLGCKTRKNWPLMYTWIVKNAIDVAQTSHLTPFQVLWLIYSFHREFIYYWWLFNKK
jgi:hypothetical protein